MKSEKRKVKSEKRKENNLAIFQINFTQHPELSTHYPGT